MMSFEEFGISEAVKRAGITYFVIEMNPNDADYAVMALLNEGQWRSSGLTGWMVRVDPERPEMHQQRHVHVAQETSTTAKTQQAAWNQDGSRHDRYAFNDKVGGKSAVQDAARKALGLPKHSFLEEVEGTDEVLMERQLLLESAGSQATFPPDAVFLRVSQRGSWKS